MNMNQGSEEKMSTVRTKKMHGSFTYRVEVFSGLSTRVGDSVESPEFELCGGHVWQLRIFPGGSLEAHRGHISFYLASKSTRAARASYRLIILNQGQGGMDETFASSGIRTFEARGVQVDGWGRDRFCSIAHLSDPSNNLLVNDTVIFKVEVTVYGELEAVSFPVVTSLHSASPNCLTKCLHNLLTTANQNTADLLLIVGAKKEKVWAHRCILAARSPVFESMLCKNLPDTVAEGWASSALAADADSSSSSSAKMYAVGGCLGSLREEVKDCYSFEETQAPPHSGGWGDQEESKLMGPDTTSWVSTAFVESATGVIVFPDVDPDVMREFLVYAYTDALSDVTVLARLAPSLLILSSKYDFQALFSAVQEYLLLQLRVDSCLDLLRLSDMYSADKLKDAAIKMVLANANYVTAQAAYRTLHSSLIAEIEAVIDASNRSGGSGASGEAGANQSRGRSSCVIA